MTIMLDLPPETEASLLAQAEARGVTLDQFIKSIITNQATAQALEQPDDPAKDLKELEQMVDDILDTVQIPEGIGEGAVHRENWYR